MLKPVVTSFFDEQTFTVSYVAQDPASARCVIVDSVLDYNPHSGRTSTELADRIIAHVQANKLDVVWILETHVHADHLTAAPYLKSHLGGQIAIGRHITDVQAAFSGIFDCHPLFVADGSQFDVLVDDNQRLPFGAADIVAWHTPGHTPACLTYIIGDAVFVGDTLFMPDYGTARADFPGGDALTLYRSIRRIFTLPEATRLFMCHDYKAPGRDDYKWETTVGEQRRHNIHVKDGVSAEEFVAMRTARDQKLDMPRLFIPSVQVNMWAGELPPPAKNGARYLKIPVNVF